MEKLDAVHSVSLRIKISGGDEHQVDWELIGGLRARTIP